MKYLMINEITDSKGTSYQIETPTYTVKMSAKKWAKFKTRAIEKALQAKFETLEKNNG